MVERPVLFRDDMVRAIREGRKTVTRRVGPTWATAKAGDRLWVREAHVSADMGPLRPDGPIAYRADFTDERVIREGGPWRPSIHMPRWACRNELEVVSVTEQRSVIGGGFLQMAVLLPDLDDDEARREGVTDRRAFIALWLEMHPHHSGPVYRVEFRRAEARP